MAEQYDLDQVEAALNKLNANYNDQDAVKTLATASRASASVRERLAEPKALETFVAVIEDCDENALEFLDYGLRCVGNACANNNAARDTINDLGFKWAKHCLAKGTDDIKLLTTKVLYNICNEHSPSQQQCYREGVHFALPSYLQSKFAYSDPSENASSAIDLLFWITGHKAELEPSLSEDLSADIIDSFARLPELYMDSLDVDDYGCLLESMLVYLRDPAVQKHAFSSVTVLLNLLRATEKKSKEVEDPEDRKILEPLCTSIIWCLSDIAAQPGFADFARDKRVIETVHDNIVTCRNDSHTNRQKSTATLTASCEVLGNILWQSPPEEGEQFVVMPEAQALDAILFAEIVETEDGPPSAAVLHSLAGLLVHLSRPSAYVREQMGSQQHTLAALQKLCRHEMSQIKQDGLKLLRALGQECPPNQERFAQLAREVMLSLNDSKSTAAEEVQID